MNDIKCKPANYSIGQGDVKIGGGLTRKAGLLLDYSAWALLYLRWFQKILTTLPFPYATMVLMATTTTASGYRWVICFEKLI